jgi:hypothetical protein
MPCFSKEYLSRQSDDRHEDDRPEQPPQADPSTVAAPEPTDMDRWIAMQEELAQSNSEGASLPLIRKAAAGY